MSTDRQLHWHWMWNISQTYGPCLWMQRKDGSGWHVTLFLSVHPSTCTLCYSSALNVIKREKIIRFNILSLEVRAKVSSWLHWFPQSEWYPNFNCEKISSLEKDCNSLSIYELLHKPGHDFDLYTIGCKQEKVMQLLYGFWEGQTATLYHYSS